MKYIELKNGKKWPLNTAYQGDCLEFMKELPDKCIDICLTDPPYGIGIDGQKKDVRKSSGEYHSNKWGRKEHAMKGWDKRPDKELFDEMFRVSKNQIFWGGNYFVEFITPSKGWIIWDKGQKGLTMSDCEMAWSSFNKPTRIFVLNRMALTIEGTIHPTQKPLKLFKWCLEKYAPENAIVFDPFLGSFTTAVACHSHGLNWIGCEKDKDYFKAGLERYETECLQNLMDFGS